MSTYKSGYAEINGAKLFYEMKGEGHPLIMIHGVPLNSTMWDAQFEELSKFFQTIRFDLAGYGKSSSHDHDYALLDDIKGLLQFLEITKTHFLGLSVGGMLSMDFTLAYPEMVDKLIVAATGLLGWTNLSPERMRFNEVINECYQNENQEEAIQLMTKYWMVGPFRQEEDVEVDLRNKYSDMIRASYSKERGNGKLILPETKTMDIVGNIEVPTLIITPEVDFPEFNEIANFLNEKIKDSQKVIIPKTAHLLNMEKPVEFNQIVLDFLLEVTNKC